MLKSLLLSAPVQITRYALRDMEKRGVTHNCRLWVGFDSPHEGAYVPLGLQYSISELAESGNSEAAIKVRDLWINCPAAEQMTLHHYKSNSETVAGVPGFFNQYYSEINNSTFGFPQAIGLRKIAMLNGSDLGVSQTFGTACQLATKFKVNYKPRGFLGYTLLLLATHYNLILYAISPIQNHETYLAPASGECTVFDFHIDLGSNITKKAIAPSWNNTSLDLVQGGFLPSFKIYKEQTEGQRSTRWHKDLFVTKVDDYVTNGAHELTYSTLAVGLGTLPASPARKWDENFRKDKFNQPTDVTCPESKESPFDMYWAPDINTRHDSLLLGHVVRLRKEIIDKQEWPRTQLQRTATITGTKILLCAGETATYSVTNPLPGMVYNWTPSSTFLQVISGQGTSTVTIQHTGSSTITGDYTINCSANSPCYNINVEGKTIYAGKQPVLGWYNSPSNSNQPMAPSGRFEFNWNDACYGEFINTSMNVWPGTTMAWQDAGNSGGVTWTQIGNNLRFYFSAPDQWAYFRVYATNACGVSMALYRFRAVEGDCGGPPLRVYISPNPSKDEVQITLAEKRNKENKKMIYEIRFIDMLGNIKRQYGFGKGTQTGILNIGKLPTNVYAVRVFDGKQWFTAKIIKR